MSVYFLQPQILRGTDRYKFGMSRHKIPISRVKSYHVGAVIISINPVSNPFVVEKEIKKIFNAKFKAIGGNEYFEGHVTEMLREYFNVILREEFFTDDEKCYFQQSQPTATTITHKLIHNDSQYSNNIKNKYYCKYCSKEFTRRNNMNRHIRLYCKENKLKQEIERLQKENLLLQKSLTSVIAKNVNNIT